MHKRVLPILVTFLFLANISYSSGMVVDFSDGMKHLCSKNKSVLLSKKMFLAILRLEKQGMDPCESENLKRLVVNCGKENSCDEVLAVFKQVISKYEGRVLGR